ncbi:glycosyltransferase [Maricaulis maris]|uniref:UDP:flavonoid glycosyltransferase YjiC (YdhE family) n=1 Tax=Maricaulis maris TaxID=74318 RepID=A0A495DKT8_9PROT|nr:glycosyltransferase [Maricaulis maris]RKR03221.1 UDP:flavonoid glycosyltransferase YjiC (YdhE family) [Maricaulis maris]
MRISIQTLGTLGDVMPYLTVARDLIARGHDVTVLAPRDYQAVIAEAGVTAAAPPGFSVKDWMTRSSERGTLRDPVRFFRDWPVMIRPHVRDVLESALAAARNADLVLANPIAMPARLAAEHHQIPFMLMALQPVLTPSAKLPCAMIARTDMGGLLNRASYLAVSAALAGLGTTLGKDRARLVTRPRPSLTNLSHHFGRPLPRITALPAVLDIRQPGDFDPASQLVDYPALSSSETALPGALSDFLAAGPPPFHLGLGSMSTTGADHRLAPWLDRLEAAGQRAILAHSLTDHPVGAYGRHYICGPLPHDRLFPHCRAVIHHGGAGTLDTAARAGRPQIILPHMLDQFWNAAMLARQGLAPKPSGRSPKPDEIDRLLAFALSPKVAGTARQRADELAARGAGQPAARSISAIIEAWHADWPTSAS